MFLDFRDDVINTPFYRFRLSRKLMDVGVILQQKKKKESLINKES
jgi:hypothetical protein